MCGGVWLPRVEYGVISLTPKSRWWCSLARGPGHSPSGENGNFRIHSGQTARSTRERCRQETTKEFHYISHRNVGQDMKKVPLQYLGPLAVW